ncbi:MAG: HAD hydrolase family protein, partial [Treponema sp.]|nr:HAD hydrolase family protein [Treponema sp.]
MPAMTRYRSSGTGSSGTSVPIPLLRSTRTGSRPPHASGGKCAVQHGKRYIPLHCWKYMQTSLQLSPDEIAVFGDDFNDIGMLWLCGRGIAMENAIAEVK